MGILELAFVAMLVLKLTGLTSISWLTVWSPIIIALVLYVIIFLIFMFKPEPKFPRRFK